MNISFEEEKVQEQSQEEPTKEASDDQVSGFMWRTFVGNKKKEDFLKSSIMLLIVINGILGFLLYNQKTQESIYVIDGGLPKLANLIDNDVRVDEQITFFVKTWSRLLLEVTSANYAGNRETLKTLSSKSLMERVLTAEKASGNRLLKELVQSETMRAKIIDIVISKIERRGSVIAVSYSEVLQIDVPDGSERYVSEHKAEIIPTNYDLNGIGLAMINIDNLWNLGRRTD